MWARPIATTGLRVIDLLLLHLCNEVWISPHWVYSSLEMVKSFSVSEEFKFSLTPHPHHSFSVDQYS